MQAGTAFEPSPSSRAGGAPSPGRHSCSAVRAPWARSSWQTASWWRAAATSSGVWAPFSTHAAACGLARRSRRAATRGRDPPWAARSSAVRSVLAPTRSTEACHLNVARICGGCEGQELPRVGTLQQGLPRLRIEQQHGYSECCWQGLRWHRGEGGVRGDRHGARHWAQCCSLHRGACCNQRWVVVRAARRKAPAERVIPQRHTALLTIHARARRDEQPDRSHVGESRRSH